MHASLGGLSEASLVRWIENRLVDGTHVLATGYQGQVLLFEQEDRRLVVKVPAGRGLRRWLSLLMLRHEARVYERLRDFPGVPRCHGLLNKRYLVLDHVQGEVARYAELADREAFFAELLQRILQLHALGIAHSDLQKRDNLFVTPDGHPCLLDFGAAVIRKRGMAPFNHLHFRVAARLDLNQWVKLKYRGQPELASPTDRRFYRRTAIERVARGLKQWWRSRLR